MPNTTSFDFADVVLVPFPFTDQSTTIERGLVIRTMGKLHADDRAALRKALDEIIGK